MKAEVPSPPELKTDLGSPVESSGFKTVSGYRVEVDLNGSKFNARICDSNGQFAILGGRYKDKRSLNKSDKEDLESLLSNFKDERTRVAEELADNEVSELEEIYNSNKEAERELVKEGFPLFPPALRAFNREAWAQLHNRDIKEKYRMAFLYPGLERTELRGKLEIEDLFIRKGGYNKDYAWGKKEVDFGPSTLFTPIPSSPIDGATGYNKSIFAALHNVINNELKDAREFEEELWHKWSYTKNNLTEDLDRKLSARREIMTRMNEQNQGPVSVVVEYPVEDLEGKEYKLDHIVLLPGRESFKLKEEGKYDYYDRAWRGVEPRLARVL